MGSYSFCGHQIGEDSKQCVVGMDVFLDSMAGRLTCVWLRDGCQPVDASRMDDPHNYSHNWNTAARPLGYEMGVHPTVSGSSMLDHHLL